jgi:selenocysteine lyase/cysteine desulfurase
MKLTDWKFLSYETLANVIEMIDLNATAFHRNFTNLICHTHMNEAYFKPFRDQIIGINQKFETPQGDKIMIYADWIASGRLYSPIEKIMLEKVAPFCANTHTETSITGTLMTKAYLGAKQFIKREVGANENDILIFSGSGMTDSINKLQRIMGLRVPELSHAFVEISKLPPAEKPVVFVTHMEHHSNHTSWLETIADVEIIDSTSEGLVDTKHLEKLLEIYKERKLKIASVTSCSNVTGIFTPYYEIAEMMHNAGGLCFVDFACSGPYVDINMHPENEKQYLDAIFISPHKFLGGPGTPGVLVLSKNLCKNSIPDNSGGGTVTYTTPWKLHVYIENIEEREDAGTPPFLQGIRAALAFKIKREMGVKNIEAREKVLVNKVFDRLLKIPNLHILQENIRDRIGAISFYIDDLHFNLGVKLLNDYFGIQVRGGCACAGTYGHILLNISQAESDRIIKLINQGDKSVRPGWIRLSIHPTMTDAEVEQIITGIEFVAANFKTIGENYEYLPQRNVFSHKTARLTFIQSWMKELYEDAF